MTAARPSPAPARKRLSRPVTELWQSQAKDWVWDVVIVGSGYGGSAAAAALAELMRTECKERKNAKPDSNAAPLSVCVLERGRELQPGEFPSRFTDLPAHLRLTRGGQVSEQQEALLDLRLGEDVMALVANGLGGGSLINAGVMLEPDPAEAGATQRGALSRLIRRGWFSRARRALGALTRDAQGREVDNTIDLHPDVGAPNGRPLPKTAALEKLAGTGARHRVVPITVAMRRGANDAGTVLEACTLCGDCMTGCNVGAKMSLDTNGLRAAADAGVQLYTGASVLSLRRARGSEAATGARWVLRVSHTDPRLQRREEKLLYVRARHVVLAAGTLGSTEILLRSRSDQLVLSSQLGSKFSCNGDNLSALYDLPEDTRANADEEQPLSGRGVGPTITSTLEVPAGAVPSHEHRRFQVQEFAIPAALRRLLHEVVTTAQVVHRLPTSDGSHHGSEAHDAPDPLAVDAAAMARSLVLGTVGHDEARGVLHLDAPRDGPDGTPQQGVVQIRWPDARRGPQLERAHDTLSRLHDEMQAQHKPTSGQRRRSTLLANPMWRMLPESLEALVDQPRGPVWTVHPLGGCPMGRGPHEGVLDPFGRVFDAARGAGAAGRPALHEGLLVLDGAVFAQSLGVNPALSIAAFAMRAARLLRRCLEQDRGKRRQRMSSDETRPPTDPFVSPTAPRPVAPEPMPYPPGEPPATKLELIERLRGTVWLHCGWTLPKPFVLELTLAYEPVAARAMMSTLGCTLRARAERGTVRTGTTDAPVAVQRLRLFDPDTWETENLRVVPEHERSPKALFEAVVDGELRFLHREASSPLGRRLRAAWAWLLNRGLRDIWEWMTERKPARDSGRGSPGFFGRVRDLWRLASRAGEVRRFDYRLTLTEVVHDRMVDDRGRPLRLFLPGQVIRGEKRLTYNRRGNPWRQLTRMTLTLLPGLRLGSSPVLEIDTRFLAGQGVPLVRITQQRDQATALADMASLVLYLARVVLSTHLWTFRLPDARGRDEPDRLPGPIAGLPAPQVSELIVGTLGDGEATATPRSPGQVAEKIKVRLTRYARPGSPLPALVMLHGYSVSGNTFTHATLRPSAAEYFWRQGRDVWVVDLRTSSGLPTCTQPWSFEQVALVDIPAALVHVRQLTGAPVDVLAHCIGCAMLSMALLTDPREVRSGRTELGVNDWLTTEHFGTLAAFNGSEPSAGAHPTVRRVVLSQKGPLLRYTDDNVLRAFVMQTLRRWLLADDFQFRPPARPGLVDQLLDRVLASLPYPEAEWNVENPLWPCKRTPWTATRHRMDALYGRDFNARHMSDATLNAIDDLFGPIHLDTVAQTIHFTRFNVVTNQRGRGEFVTHRRLRERWGPIATLALHGGDNGLADVSTQSLLREQLGEAGVDFEGRVFDGMGHQDTLLGKASYQVFEAIEAFLRKPAAPRKPAPVVSPGVPGKVPVLPDPSTRDAPAEWVFEEPWAGPRIQMPDLPAGAVAVAALSRPDQGEACLVLVPARRRPHAPRFEVIAAPERVTWGEKHQSGRWLTALPALASWPDPTAHAEGEPGWLALLLYELDETAGTRRVAASPPLPREAKGPAAPAEAARSGPGSTVIVRALGRAEWLWERVRPAWLDADAEPPEANTLAGWVIEGARAWLRVQPEQAATLSFITLADLVAAQALVNAGPGRNRLEASPWFAVASCQYPAALFDGLCARASLDTLAQAAGDPASAAGQSDDRVRFALLLGDQIYADATAGLADPVRRDELFEQPNERALRAPGMRAVLRRLPVAALLDDHEIADNWEPLASRFDPPRRVPRPSSAAPPALTPSRPPWPQWKRTREHGLAAFWRYQRMQHLDGLGLGEMADGDHALQWGGVPVYLLDTRSTRGRRASDVAEGKRLLIDERQRSSLQNWLRRHKDRPKIVATASLLLPRRWASFEGPGASVRSDAWDGYPASMSWLLDFLLLEQVRHTIFVSGDEHHSLVCEVTLRALRDSSLAPLKLVSVHSSALYAPYPFANGRSAQLSDEPFHTKSGCTEVTMHTTPAPPGDGFALLRVTHDPAPAGASAPEYIDLGAVRLRVRFAKGGSGP
jgi:cholesterol oxidase